MQLQWETPGHGGSQLVTAVIHVLFHSTCKHTRPRDVQGPGIPAGPAGMHAKDCPECHVWFFNLFFNLF